jgi:LacI family repressor for deo operon, udp, cdd, tsx, nupC, and nupG
VGERVVVSLADVARAADVSMATASRALNNAYGVSPVTRSRVLEAARRLDFVVSPDAARLASGTTNAVAVLVQHLDRWYFGEMVAAIESILSGAGYDVLLYHVNTQEDRSKFFADLPARRKVDGVIVVAFPISDYERERLELMDVRIVAAGGQSVAYPYVSIDDGRAVQQALEHLIRLGHRRIAMVTASGDTLAPAETGRTDAYRDALEEAGIAFDPELLVTCEWGGVPAAEATERLLGLKQLPTAILAHSDEMALGCMRTLRRSGVRVPEDISVIGIDDHPLAELADLTTVRQSVSEQGRLSAELLLAFLDGVDAETEQVTNTYVVTRRSTGPVNTSRAR